jgi:CubicO group peptidase (beta-lactamase class C family)
MIEISGTCEPRFEPVREAFRQAFANGEDVGASFAVALDGELVVDLWGGYADAAKTRPWERDTIVCVYSTTKTMAALCALILADRGAIDLHAPVAKYWPEFAQNGKERVEVRHFLSHSAGLPTWEKPITLDVLYDWQKATSLLAAQAPQWEPGTASGYHAVTQGYLIGEVVRRVTGKSPGTFFRETIAEPMGADFHIGLDPKHFARVGEMIPPASAPAGVASAANPPMDARESATSAWRQAEIPAANGHGNARSVAMVQSLLACGGEAFGVKVMSQPGCDAVMEEQTNGLDRVLGFPIRFGMGYGLLPRVGDQEPRRACFWGGWGGSLAYVDLDSRVSIAYVMNRMNSTTTGDSRSAVPLRAFFHALAGRQG